MKKRYTIKNILKNYKYKNIYKSDKNYIKNKLQNKIVQIILLYFDIKFLLVAWAFVRAQSIC